jgi:hypothetical protein
MVGTAHRFLTENLVYPIRPFYLPAKYPLVVLGLAMALFLGSCSQEPSPVPPKGESSSQGQLSLADKVLKVVKDRKGRHQAKVVQRGAKQLVVRDSQPGPEYDRIGALAFSADGRILAYEAWKGQQQVVVLGEQEWPLEAEVVQDSFRMSPDSKRLALVACANHKCQVMVDGRPDPPFDFIFPPTLKFSPNSKHIGYLALKGGKLLVVVDGKVVDHLDILTEGSQALKESLSRADQADVAQTPGEPAK